MVQWVKNAGRILVMGDSISLGYNSQLGGWRPGLGTQLSSAGIGYQYVGPLADAYGNHNAVISTALVQQTSNIQTMCVTYRPRIVLVGWGVNDIGGVAAGGQGRTSSQALNDLDTVIDWIQAGAPQALIFVQSLVVPQTNDIPSYYAVRADIAAFNTALPARCAAQGAYAIDIGAPPTSDGLHPTQVGYGLMVTSIFTGVSSALPG